MAKQIKIDFNKFIWAYELKNQIGGYVYKVRQIADDFKISVGTVNTIADKLKLSKRGKGRTRTNKCSICQYEFEVCICGGIAHG